MLNRIFAVVRREYLAHVRTKAFWISTLLVPVIMGVLMIVPALMATRGAGEYTVAVLDLSGRFFEPVEATLLAAREWGRLGRLDPTDPDTDDGGVPDGLEDLDAIASGELSRPEGGAGYHVAVDSDGNAPARQTQDINETAHSTSRGDDAGLAVDE